MENKNKLISCWGERNKVKHEAKDGLNKGIEVFTAKLSTLMACVACPEQIKAKGCAEDVDCDLFHLNEALDAELSRKKEELAREQKERAERDKRLRQGGLKYF
ncbi:MAG: hypothetical protein LBM01_00310 [Christensenellaceae bacterium]|jgi:hypothetical protein|nr:hypothetical protein [Christensenellaceae bacterium]